MQVNKSKLYLFYFLAGDNISSCKIFSTSNSYQEIKKMNGVLSFFNRCSMIIIPSLDKIFVKDPDVFKDNNTHYFKGIKCLFDDYPFLKEVVRYAKETD